LATLLTSLDVGSIGPLPSLAGRRVLWHSLPQLDTLLARVKERCTEGTRAMIDTRSATLRDAWPSLRRLWPLLPAAGAIAGCSASSAPAIILFGAYFPDWLVFAILAIVIAIAARIAFGLAGLAQSVPFSLFTYLAIGILVAGAIDFIWLDR
jgi:hypothetical protein